MSENRSASEQRCVFCTIAAGDVDASRVYEDEVVVAFMDTNPVTPGHLLVVPREHAVGFEDVDDATSTHVWRIGHQIARALRRSSISSDGINMFVADGEAAFQTVFHFHLHVIPRSPGDGWSINAVSHRRDWSLLESDAAAIREAIPSIR
ncbi:HIT family protein [Leifsonia sp. SIMBA_070]|uniref:HIT family protein n=1 Tax=Leifsonia sp. SIMBA_070 TaxID=3085810 RepID=UPI00397BAE4F